MSLPNLSHIRTWVFDLDNTLYPPSVRLFDQIETRMTAWVSRTLNVSADHADTLRHEYWRDYGTTLAGLMHHHGTPPEDYLHYVHDIDFSVVPKDEHLHSAISALKGRKIVYTNGSAPYARNVLQARGLEALFDAVYGVENAGYHPKPHQHAYDAIIAADGFDPTTAVMFEDDPRNLRAPKDLGMATVHVAPYLSGPVENFIDYHTDDLTAFLRQIS